MSSQNEVSIRWLGHSCFLIADHKTKIVTDPFDQSVGYPLPQVTADLVLVSHDHFDHNFVSAIKGDFKVVKDSGEKDVKGLSFKGIHSVHDDKGGSLRGENTIFVWEMGEMRFCHMGDLGQILDADQVTQIGAVDVLFIPVGGHFTIDSKVATEVVYQLNPKAVFPMHYKTDALGSGFPIAGVDAFLAGKQNVKKVGENSITLSKGSLPQQITFYVLDYR